MEHDIGSVPLEYLKERLAVVDVDEGLATRTLQDGHGVMKVGLVVVEQDELGGTEAGDLAADLRTDGTTSAGDQHPVGLE
jgi:hypothetical protein